MVILLNATMIESPSLMPWASPWWVNVLLIILDDVGTLIICNENRMRLVDFYLQKGFNTRVLTQRNTLLRIL